MGIHHHQVQQSIVVAGSHASDALAATVLRAVCFGRYPFDVATLAQGNHHVLVGNKLLRRLVLYFFFVDNRPTGITEVFLQFTGLRLN